MTPRFATDTAVTPLGEGRWGATVDPAWRVERPNGGYVAALVLRAVTAELDDPARRPRSMTIHYLRPPDDGPIEVAVTVERSGRRMSFLSARLLQHGRTLATALVAAGTEQSTSFTLDDAPMPEVGAPEDCERLPDPPFPIPLRENFETRLAIGSPPFWDPGTSAEAVTGGWIRLRDPVPVDAEYLVQVADAWVPAAFGVTSERIGLPTVDLTVHLRHQPVGEDPWLLVRFRTRVAAEGYLEEDGEIWDRSGRLLAQSRQLAALV
ncbi:MAG TPA: thioesterase family protein [Acidimicrobiales bacterium]|nr:thioesterase family protein [Acidimicrobiales bacterium]